MCRMNSQPPADEAPSALEMFLLEVSGGEDRGSRSSSVHSLEPRYLAFLDHTSYPGVPLSERSRSTFVSETLFCTETLFGKVP